MSKIKSRTIFIVSIVLMLSLAGCSSATVTPTPEESKITLAMFDITYEYSKIDCRMPDNTVRTFNIKHYYINKNASLVEFETDYDIVYMMHMSNCALRTK